MTGLSRISATCECGLLALAFSAQSLSAQTVVGGPSGDRPLGLRLERLWSVGGVDDEELVFSTLYDKDVATDANGRLLVIDRTEFRVVEFDSRGRQTRTFGAKGLGPGELTAPLSIEVVSSGAIQVFDAVKSAIVVFGADGRVLPELRMPLRVRQFRHLANGQGIGTSQRRDTVRLVALREDALVPLMTLVLPPSRSTPPVCRLTDYPARPVFAPNLTWALRDNLLVASTGAFSLTVFEGTERRRTLARDTPRRRSTPALARQHLGPGETMQLLGERPCTIPAEMILSVAEVSPTLPAYEAVAIAPDNRIWATRFTVRAEPGVADVYDAVRGYLGSVPLGSAKPVAFLSTGELVSLEHDHEEVPQLVVYALRRSPQPPRPR